MRNGRLTLDMICRRYVAARFKNIDCTYEGLPLSTHSDSDPITSEDEVPGQVPSDAAGVMGTSFSPSTLCSWPWWPYKLTTQDAILIVQGAMTTQDAILIVQGAMISSFVSSCSFNFSSSADAWHRAEKMLSKSSHVFSFLRSSHSDWFQQLPAPLQHHCWMTMKTITNRNLTMMKASCPPVPL